MNRFQITVTAGAAIVASVSVATAPVADADNKRLNDGVVASVYTMQHRAGCTNDVLVNPQLQLAAEWHAKDMLNNRSLAGDIGSDGSTPQSRANAAGFHGNVAQTVAINPALAINNLEIIQQWHRNPAYHAIMSDCNNNIIGVWSENSLDRSVVVAVYGHEDRPPLPPPLPRNDGTTTLGSTAEPPAWPDPFPDYDASDELEYGINWLPWILRGVYPPPAYPPR